MNDKKNTFDVLASVEKHIEALKPLLPKQAVVCIGEYPIKILLKDPGMSKSEGTLSVLIEKSSDDIYKWIPKGFKPYLILGFEDAKIDTHFWYDVLPYISKDEMVLETLKKKSLERLHGATIVASVWDGVGSAFLPALMSEFKSSNINSIGIAVLPSKIQPADAHFNAYAAIERSLAINGATVLLTDRDHLESYEGVDRKGLALKGSVVTNYLINFLLGKETLVEELSELSRTFNVEMYTFLLVTGASYKIYGSLENMLNTALLKPFLTFDLSTASVLHVLLRMPLNLKDKLPRGKIELAIANWFKEKANLQSIYITEPIYTEDTNDRVDAVLFIGGFDTSKMFTDYENKSATLQKQAVEKGFMTENWQIPAKPEITEEPQKSTEIPPPLPEAVQKDLETPTEQTQVAESQIEGEAEASETTEQIISSESAAELKAPEIPSLMNAQKVTEETAESVPKPKRARRTRRTIANKS